MITSFCVHECEGSSRMGSRPRRVLFSGHANGCVQIWDLSTALDLSNKAEPSFVGGPTPSELVRSLEQCEVVASRASTPAPTPHLLGAAGSASGTAGDIPSARVKAANVPLLLQLRSQNVDSAGEAEKQPEEREDEADENA